MTAEAPSAGSPLESRSARIRALAARYAITTVFFALLIALLIVNPMFRDPNNLWNVLQQNSIIGIVACGMLVMMIAGGFDLSVGSVGSASTVVAALVFINVSIPAGVIAGLTVCLLLGALNCLLLTTVGINPSVTSPGTPGIGPRPLFLATSGAPA